MTSTRPRNCWPASDAPKSVTKDQVAEAVYLLIRCRSESSWLQGDTTTALTLAKAEKMQRVAATRIACGSNWLTGLQLCSLTGNTSAQMQATLGRGIRDGRVFALTCRRTRIYPEYAFDPEWRPLPILRDVLACFADRPPVVVAAWFESRIASLDGRRPRELIACNGSAVLAAAQRDQAGSIHG